MADDTVVTGGDTTTGAATTSVAQAQQNPAMPADGNAAPTKGAQDANPATASQQTDANTNKEGGDKTDGLDGLVGDNPNGDGDDGANKAPESYSFDTLTVGESQEFDEVTAKEFATVAKELGLDQKAFETIFNKMAPVLERRNQEQMVEIRKSFLASAKADPELKDWNGSLAIAKKALYQFTDDATRDLLKESGLDCHPGIIRMFKQVGMAISNDTIVRGTVSGGKRDAAQAFFYNSKMN